VARHGHGLVEQDVLQRQTLGLKEAPRGFGAFTLIDE